MIKKTHNQAQHCTAFGCRTLASSRWCAALTKERIVEITEENELEEILRLAADEPAHRPQFCEVLLSSQVFLLGTTGVSGADGEVDLEAGSKIQIQHWKKADGSPVIPFFSSLEVLQKSINSEESYLALPVRSLFEMTQGATLFLNSKSDYGQRICS